MSLIPWRNKREGQETELSPLVSLRSEMDRLFDSFLREPFGAMDWPHWGAGKWSPAVDVAEDDKEVDGPGGTARHRSEGSGRDGRRQPVGSQRREAGVEREQGERGLPQRDPLRLVPPHGAAARGRRYRARRCPVRQRRADASPAKNGPRRSEADRSQSEVTPSRTAEEPARRTVLNRRGRVVTQRTQSTQSET